ncbi:hypothetical protein P8452_05361 [Trifolium repens]|nr:hypothetical protein P8452_05361 [Trifolium repens]
MVVDVGSTMGLSQKKNLIIQVITGRWFVVFASFLIMSASGATYMFGFYSGTIKTALGYDQTTLNLLSFFKDLGGNLGIFSGLINEITPPYVVLAMGSVLNFFGANSQSFSNTGSLVTCVKNFPETRGVVLGILKGFVGLSGAIITQLYSAIYFNDPKALILLIAWLPAAISFLFLRTVRYMKPNKLVFKQSEYIGSASVVLILLFLPIAVVFVEQKKIYTSQKLAFVDPFSVKIVTDQGAKNSATNNAMVSVEEKETRWWQNIFSPPEKVARTIQFYKGDIYKRYRSEPVEVEEDTTEMKVVQSGGERVQDEAKAAEK